MTKPYPPAVNHVITLLEQGIAGEIVTAQEWRVVVNEVRNTIMAADSDAAMAADSDAAMVAVWNMARIAAMAADSDAAMVAVWNMARIAAMAAANSDSPISDYTIILRTLKNGLEGMK